MSHNIPLRHKNDENQENARSSAVKRHNYEPVPANQARPVLQDVSNAVSAKRQRSLSMQNDPSTILPKTKPESDSEDTHNEVYSDAREYSDTHEYTDANEAYPPNNLLPSDDAGAAAAAYNNTEVYNDAYDSFSSSEEELLLSTPHYTSVSDFRQPHGMQRTFVHRMQYVDVSPEPIYDEEGNDLSDDADPIMCEEYSDEIYSYMYMQQEQYMVNPLLLQRLPSSFQWEQNRHTLMNWLVSIHRKFRLVGETLYLTTNIIDRYLAHHRPVKLDDVQLIAATAMFIASKYEEVMAPAVTHFAYVASSTADQVREMEKKILIELEFDLGMPQPLNFLRRISKADDYQMETRTVAKFLLEIMLFDTKLMVYRPSDIAAAAMFTSRLILGIHGWPRNFVHYSGGCREQELLPIVEKLRAYLRSPCEKVDEVFIGKYSSKRSLRAAPLAIEWARK